MARAIKLKKVQHGVWDAADGRFRFEFWDHAQGWYVYERSPHADDDGFYDEPSFGIGFDTLGEAVEYAARNGSVKDG